MLTEAVLKCLRHIAALSNSNIVRNADGLLCRKKEEVPVGWTSETKVRSIPDKFKLSY